MGAYRLYFSFSVDLPTVKNVYGPLNFVNTWPYRAKNFETLLLLQFSIFRSQPNVMSTLATMGEYALSLSWQSSNFFFNCDTFNMGDHIGLSAGHRAMRSEIVAFTNTYIRHIWPWRVLGYFDVIHCTFLNMVVTRNRLKKTLQTL